MQKYDVAVVGAGFAGLSVAALLSKAGKKVVLTDPYDKAGGAVAPFEKDGFRFFAGPNAVYGLEQGGPLHALCTQMGMDGAVSLPPARYQVVMPDRRVTVAPSREETLDELRREFPREIDRLIALHRDAEKISLRCASSRFSAYLAGRRSAGAFLRTYAFSPELSAFFSVRAWYFFGQGLDSLPLRKLLRMLGTAPVDFPGGYARLAAQLASGIIDRSGAVLWNETWPELLISGRRASGIRTAQGTRESRTVIVNAEGRTSERSLFLGVREDVIPVRMENTVLCLSDHRYPENYHSLSVSRRESNAPAGTRAIVATFPFLEETGSPGNSPFEKIQAIMPFLRDFIITDASPDNAERCIPLPDGVDPRLSGKRSRQQLPFRGSLKNVLVLPDSSRLMLPSIQAALQTAARLT